MGVLTPIPALCDVLGWTLDRLERAIDNLDATIRPAGLRIHRLHRSIQIVRSTEAAEQDTIGKAMRKHFARDGLNLTEARMLRRVQLGDLPKEPSNPESVAIGVLTNAALISPAEPTSRDQTAALHLDNDVRYSLLLEEF